MFLYSQDLSNSKTAKAIDDKEWTFLYSQDLSNSKTPAMDFIALDKFLYSQDLSNSKTCTVRKRILSGFCTLKI